MSVKDDAEEIESLALMPVCGSPNARHRRYMNITFVKFNLQSKPVMLCGREEMIVNLETRLFFYAAVDATKISQKIKLRIRPSLQRAAYVNDMQLGDYRGHLAEGFDNLRHPVSVLKLQRRHPAGRR